jgi:hypothetical protein
VPAGFARLHMTGSAFDARDNVFGVIFGLGTLALGSNTSLSKINGLQRHAVTATFRLLYVFVVIEHRSRQMIHCAASVLGELHHEYSLAAADA